jgi:hypothetical protein
VSSKTFDQIIADLLAGPPVRGEAATRPSYTAHPATWWTPETTAAHLAGCSSARDEHGEWRPWTTLSEGERWCAWWEEYEGYRAMGDVTEVEVP